MLPQYHEQHAQIKQCLQYQPHMNFLTLLPG